MNYNDRYHRCYGRGSSNLKNKINALEEIKIAHVIFYKGQLEGKDIVLTQSGIGKVNVAISTTLLIEQFKPDLIINTGSAVR